MRQHDLESGRAAEANILGVEDDAHATDAQDAQDTVCAKPAQFVGRLGRPRKSQCFAAAAEAALRFRRFGQSWLGQRFGSVKPGSGRSRVARDEAPPTD